MSAVEISSYPAYGLGACFLAFVFPSWFMGYCFDWLVASLIVVVARYTEPSISSTFGQLFAPLTARELVRSSGTQSRSAGLKLSRF